MNDEIAADRWQRQKALFQEALACEAARRIALLDGVRASDPGLADEVAAMLAAHESEGAFLAEPFVAARSDVWLGATLEGKYRVEERLGRGGMGSVYRATHLWTGRTVALKIIAPEFMANPEFVERFKREAKAAGRLRHPNVVDVTDFGFEREGPRRAAYLVMEYLDGETLAAALDREPLPPIAFVADVLEQIALAVDEAHEQGILHRDLKPSNIWLEPDGRGGRTVKVLDFGLAKLIAPIGGDSVISQDVRITKKFYFGETMHLDFIFEGFNIFNVANLTHAGNLTLVAQEDVDNFVNDPENYGNLPFNFTTLREDTRQTNLFGSGGPRAFQFALKFVF